MYASFPDSYQQYLKCSTADMIFIGGLELRTPVIDIEPGWRSNTIMTWRHLQEYYHILPNHECATHVHVSLSPNYSLNQLKRIASAVIYFEPAFEALMPEDRRGNEWARSIWLESPHFAVKGRSRNESIKEIEKAPSQDALISLLHAPGDPSYAWNFWSLTTPKRTIEFRQPPASTTVQEVLSWAELTLNFIQVSLIYGSRASLADFPANIKGLRRYLYQVYEAGINEPSHLRSLWAGKSPTAALEPIPEPMMLPEWTPGLTAMACDDDRRIRQHPKFYT